MCHARFTVVAFCVGLLAGCNASDSDKPIEIGHVYAVHPDDPEFRAIELAVEDINKGNRLHKGRPIAVRHAPGGTKPEEWGAQASRLIALNKVQCLIGAERSTAAEQIGTAVQGEKVIAISPAAWAGAPASQNLFTVGVSPQERGRVLALVAKSAVEGKSGGILILRDPAAKAANAAGDRFAADCRAFAPVADLDISASKKPAAAIVFFACPARAALQHRESFQGALLLFGDEDAELTTLLEGPGADGFCVASSVDPTGTPERLAAFQQRYEEKHKQRPTPAAVLTYDAITVWAEAAHRADELEAAAIRGQLLKRDTPFDVLTGSLLFADDHTARRPVFVGHIASGKLVDIKTYEPGLVK